MQQRLKLVVAAAMQDGCEIDEKRTLLMCMLMHMKITITRP